MKLIKWRDEFCTGIPGVDFEHQQLIEEINLVFAMIDENDDKGVIIDKLGDIYGSISAHFALEEQIMERHGYEHYEAHRANHEELLDDIRDITDELEDSTVVNRDKFKEKLTNWFQIHFSTHDARLHKLTKLVQCDEVDSSTLKNMIQKAKMIFVRKVS